jgi:arylsulfatase
MATEDDLPRQVLPIPDRKPVSLTTYDAKDPDTKFPPIRPLRPPAGAPTCSSSCSMTSALAPRARSAVRADADRRTARRQGLKYTRFHTTALCSPTRAAMLSGRNHHAVGMGGITEIRTSAPGYNSLRPNTCAPLAEILKLNGYSTAQFGQVPRSPGVRDHADWPVQSLAYRLRLRALLRFIGGENNQYIPALYDGHYADRTRAHARRGYHLMADLADKAIGWIRQQKAMAPDKPFFTYFAQARPTHRTTSRRTGLRSTREVRSRAGTTREETCARQKSLGVIPADCELTKRPDRSRRGT